MVARWRGEERLSLYLGVDRGMVDLSRLSDRCHGRSRSTAQSGPTKLI